MFKPYYKLNKHKCYTNKTLKNNIIINETENIVITKIRVKKNKFLIKFILIMIP